jgi:hypothetical protein
MTPVERIEAAIAELKAIRAILVAAAAEPCPPGLNPGPLAADQAPTKATLQAAANKADRGLIWGSYSTAFRGRYGVDPVRNATVNTQIASLHKRLGLEEAIEVAAFYLTVTAPAYVGHPVGGLLRDCERLSTMRRTGCGNVAHKPAWVRDREDLVSKMTGGGQ